MSQSGAEQGGVQEHETLSPLSLGALDSVKGLDMVFGRFTTSASTNSDLIPHRP